MRKAGARATAAALVAAAILTPGGGAFAQTDPPQPAAAPSSGSATPPVSFSDVSATPGSGSYSAFAKEIEWMAASGISTGYELPDGRREYRPFAPVARDAMAAFLFRAAVVRRYVPPRVSPFVDVPTTHPFYTEIAWLDDQKISTGWDIGGGKREFRPSAPITRDAMAAFLFRILGPQGYRPPATPMFRDVPTSAPFSREISWLASAGISTGWDAGGGQKDYRPYDAITRDAMAAFLYRTGPR